MIEKIHYANYRIISCVKWSFFSGDFKGTMIW